MAEKYTSGGYDEVSSEILRSRVSWCGHCWGWSKKKQGNVQTESPKSSVTGIVDDSTRVRRHQV